MNWPWRRRMPEEKAAEAVRANKEARARVRQMFDELLANADAFADELERDLSGGHERRADDGREAR